MTAYNAVTSLEIEATHRLVEVLQARPGGRRLEQVLWAASGSEAIQKALWAAWPAIGRATVIVATRYGFHGKKGLANAVTGSETDRDRDPRVRFISFPMTECADVSDRGRPFDPAPYRRELDALLHQLGRRLTALITEPYLGGGGSYHPPAAYLQTLQSFCRENDLIFILDEVQSNFGRTGDLFAYETYGLEPDVVVLGKGLGNGVPVAAAAGPADLFGALDYGEASDTWSANPLVLRGRAGDAGGVRRRRRAGTKSADVGRAGGGVDAAEGTAVHRPCPRRKGRHGVGRGDARPRRANGRRVGQRRRAGVLPGRGRRRHPPDGAAGEEGDPRRAAADPDGR